MREELIVSLNKDLDNQKELLKQRTQQANINLKKLTQINLNMQAEIESLRKQTVNLQQQLDLFKKKSVSKDLVYYSQAKL